MHSFHLRVPPLLLVLIFAIAMVAIDSVWNEWAVVFPWRWLAASTLSVCGAMLALAGVVEFRRAQTTVNPLTPEASSAIVTSRVYRFSRNPMYLGMLLLLSGLATLLANPLNFLLLPMFVLILNHLQIIPEENFLLAKFGQDYRDYQHQVRRWL
jgi:protein-S-isoprenylcysteine O-methyltransferase Ste14